MPKVVIRKGLFSQKMPKEVIRESLFQKCCVFFTCFKVHTFKGHCIDIFFAAKKLVTGVCTAKSPGTAECQCLNFPCCRPSE